MKRVIVWALRLGLGGLFLGAGVLKLRDPAGFATAIANYQLFPGLAGLLAATLPTTEILVGLALLAASRRWRVAAGVGMAFLTTLFTIAVVSAVVRGINVSCGCFGADGGPVGPLTIVRDVALLAAVCAVVVLDRDSRPLD